MSNVFTTILRDGEWKPLRWKDRQGTMHSAEGAMVNDRTRLIWTRCGCRDVPAGEAWVGYDPVTCKGCQIAEGAAK